MDTAAAIVVPCGATFAATLAWFCGLQDGRLFAVDEIFPADAPREATISGGGLALRLLGSEATADEVAAACSKLEVQLTRPEDSSDTPDDGAAEVAPNGVRIIWRRAASIARWKRAGGVERSLPPPLALPRLQSHGVEVSRASDCAFVTGRAGLEYRDLVPSRLGGALIASAIRIRKGGPVPDYVHFHLVRFQLIYCVQGWVRVVYEGQGDPFLLRPGDFVTQPPTIRHRVLESSDHLEVLEIGVPAEHLTCADRSFSLPDAQPPDDAQPASKRRRFDEANGSGLTFGGQHFCRFEATASSPFLDAAAGSPIAWAETKVREASGGVAAVRFGRASCGEPADCAFDPDPQGCHFRFARVNSGSATLETRSSGADSFEATELNQGDCFLVPREVESRLRGASSDLHLIEVALLDY